MPRIEAATLPDRGVHPSIRIEVLKICRACPAYTLSLYEDGAVIYEGQESVPVLAKIQINVPAERVQMHLQHLRQLGFFALAPKLIDSPLASLPAGEITVRDGAQEHQVTFQNLTLPTNLKEVWSAIEADVDIQQWICPFPRSSRCKPASTGRK